VIDSFQIQPFEEFHVMNRLFRPTSETTGMQIVDEELRLRSTVKLMLAE
jgi:hypothetical protein